MYNFRSVLKFIAPDAVVFTAFAICFLAMQFWMRPLQIQLVSPLLVATLIFLPHGVRVITIWMFKHRAIVPLFVAEMACIYLWGNLNMPIANIVRGAVAGSLSCWFAFEIFRMCGYNLYWDETETPASWKCLILVASVGSVVNSIGHTIAYRSAKPFEDEIAQILAFLFGDITGTITLLFIMMIASRWMRLVADHR
ncbi:hypothetical protein B9057_02630 [Aestuarium zhoushanense]|nr:hypothetical protein B9057_02630 [Aestuarium zhoushanense]